MGILGPDGVEIEKVEDAEDIEGTESVDESASVVDEDGGDDDWVKQMRENPGGFTFDPDKEHSMGGFNIPDDPMACGCVACKRYIALVNRIGDLAVRQVFRIMDQQANAMREQMQMSSDPRVQEAIKRTLKK